MMTVKVVNNTMVREKREVVKELDNFVTGLYAMEEEQKPNIISNEGIYLLCAFCGSREIEFRIDKYRFCEKHWKLLNLFVEYNRY